MSLTDDFRKGSYYPLTRRLRGPIDAVAFAQGPHLLICITAVVDGRREVVGLDVQPAPAGLSPERFVLGGELPHAVLGRMDRVLDLYDEFSPDTFKPVSSALLRGIPLTTVLAFRQHEVAMRQKILSNRRRLEGSPWASDELSAEDEARLAYLDDALMYVSAVRERAKPAEVIARARSISTRTAEGRIAKARALGLLTPAVGRTASGDLTEDAMRLDRLLKQLSGEEGEADG